MVADMTALGRAGVPDDVGPMIAALLSGENRWINGQRIEVSGACCFEPAPEDTSPSPSAPQGGRGIPKDTEGIKIRRTLTVKLLS
jgi:hypothetical protein